MAPTNIPFHQFQRDHRGHSPDRCLIDCLMMVNLGNQIESSVALCDTLIASAQLPLLPVKTVNSKARLQVTPDSRLGRRGLVREDE